MTAAAMMLSLPTAAQVERSLGLLLRRDGSAAARWGLGREQQDHLLSRFLVPQPRTAASSRP